MVGFRFIWRSSWMTLFETLLDIPTSNIVYTLTPSPSLSRFIDRIRLCSFDCITNEYHIRMIWINIINWRFLQISVNRCKSVWVYWNEKLLRINDILDALRWPFFRTPLSVGLFLRWRCILRSVKIRLFLIKLHCSLHHRILLEWWLLHGYRIYCSRHDVRLSLLKSIAFQVSLMDWSAYSLCWLWLAGLFSFRCFGWSTLERNIRSIDVIRIASERVIWWFVLSLLFFVLIIIVFISVSDQSFSNSFFFQLGHRRYQSTFTVRLQCSDQCL